MIILIILESLVVSSALYYYLHKKTRISTKYFYIDNLAVVILSAAITLFFMSYLPESYYWIGYIVAPMLVLLHAFMFTMIRFWRTPVRKTNAKETEIISPADGNVIYIKKIGPDETPISIKKKRVSRLDELTKTDLLKTPCWLIGINMTPFDVHKNCAPIEGEIVLQKYFPGKFLSLKNDEALAENERNTFVFSNKKITVGIVQIASRLVRKIDVYKSSGQQVKRGDWVGMIRFGSQVDIILPASFKVNIGIGDQVYVGETVIAKPDENIS
jgi:phosphatidylserine decarboxylase